MAQNRNNQAIVSLFYFLIIVSSSFSSSSLGLLEKNTNSHQANHSNSGQNHEELISGVSFLNFSGPISHRSIINATWYAEVSVDESYGTDLLENRTLGLLEQIDSELGNSDGWLDYEEIEDFADMVLMERNWSNAYIAGCCMFDYSPMMAVGEPSIVVRPPEIGSVNRTDVLWGWTESANLTGISDGRVLRLIDLPRVGGIIEEVPLWVDLPDGWEFRFSPMSELISGEPNTFLVNRSMAPVAYDIRITIDANEPPRISGNKFPSSSTTTLDRTTSFSSTCFDSHLEVPIVQWIVSLENMTVHTHQNPWIEFAPSDLGFSHGDPLNVTATCTDSHGSSSIWKSNSVVDGVSPTWSGTITTNGRDNIDIEKEFIEVPAGTTIQFYVNASDDSGLPVSLEMHTNISNGWRQTGTTQNIFHFTANQGFEVNGPHLDLYSRHIQRNPTEIAVQLLVIDDAGNTISEEWTVRVLDSSSPTIIPKLFSNGIEIEFDEAHQGDNLTLDLSQSFDDLDDINQLDWSIWVNGISQNELHGLLLSNANWTEAESVSIPLLGRGFHEIIVNSTDSKGNSIEQIIDIVVLPKRGAHISIIETSFSGDQVGGMGTLFVTYQNDGTDDAYARVCLSDVCGRWSEQPISSTLESGPKRGMIEFQFEIESEDIQNLTLQWDSNAAGTNGEIGINVSLVSQDPTSNNYGIILMIAIPALLGAGLVLHKNRNSELR